jgi:methylated-DNA-[protein]-cysteine S-methyltransferase
MSVQRRRLLQRATLPQITVRTLRVPFGTIEVAASSRHLLYIGLARTRSDAALGRWWQRRSVNPGSSVALESALFQLREYFGGERWAFELALDPGGTDFQRLVWEVVLTIPFGKTISYGELARRVGSSARAVGGAVGANPIPIVIPCHRVVGVDGSLTGYGGGLRMKVWLLRNEGALLA